ncbi:MAG: rhomboid family intramembrane serine protease [Pseudomonadales bacterium]|nr:rhomboid family intramembrane serine protease [Pseudomonadales bacterium]
MFSVIELAPEQDISAFSRLLWQQKISHRVDRHSDRQILIVPRENDVQRVMLLYRRWLAGEISPAVDDSAEFASYFNGRELLGRWLHAFGRAPLTLSLIVVCVVLAVLTRFGADRAVLQYFLYPDFSLGGSTIYLSRVLADFTAIQFLRMISPMLLHFSLLHIVFNMLWLWELGRRIEALQASWSMLVLVLVLALISNTVQYLVGGGNNFGGMSGVVYGLFAYCWMWQLFDPAKGLGLPGGLIFFMLLSLLIITALGLQNIANAAHIGGLLSGVVYGATVATISRVRRALRTPQS